MRNLFGRNLIIGVLCAGFVFPAAAAVVYNNTTNDLTTRFNPGTLEVGDEIILAGTDRTITRFSFEFWATAPGFNFDGTNVQVKVSFYANDGVLFNGEHPAPGTKLWESSWFTIAGPTPRNTLIYNAGSDFPAPGIDVPTDMTWSVQFQGLGAGDAAGIDLFSPPSVGQSYPDYWQNSETGWVLMQNSVPMDFAASFEATTIPEPSTLAMSILGGLGLLFSRQYLRRR